MSDSIIKIHALSYSVEEKKILDNISLPVTRNRFIGIIGANGSGKTTLLKHLYNAITPKKKTVFIKGRAIETYKQQDIAQILSVMKQENTSDFNYQVIDIVLMGRLPYKKSFEDYSDEDFDLAISNLEKLGMKEFCHRNFNSLSGGEKQRVLIARALTQDTELFILDEPTNHLDIFYQIFLMHVLKTLSITVIAVFHDLNLAAKYCDEIHILKNGQIVMSGRPKDVITSAMIRDIFQINSEIIESGDDLHVVYKDIFY